VTRAAKFTTVLFDADSTLSAIEGIDWLAERRGAAVAHEIAALTDRAMNGLVPLDDVYAERVARIRPTRVEIEALSHAYIAHIVPGTAELVQALLDAGVTVHVISGGLREALLPLAAHLGITSDRVHAVSLHSSAHDEVFDMLDGSQPLATQGGKPEVVRQLLAAGAARSPVAMIGDGSTDAAVAPHVDAFIAFTAVTRRAAVLAAAHADASSMASLSTLLFEP